MLRLHREVDDPTTPAGPQLSVIVAVHDMPSQAPRTLLSLSRRHQRDVGDLPYEVIVVDNGSSPPLDAARVRALGPEFRIVTVQDAAQSPLAAVNAAVDASAGALVAVILDGACLVTPGVLAAGRSALLAWPDAFCTTYAWHLGHEQQTTAVQHGYDTATEERLLRQVGWPEDGYALFDVAALDPSNPDGWFGHLAESRFFMTSRRTWDRLGGYDEAFVAPGGGLGGLDLFERVCALDDVELVGLLGEGSFHQVHGGITTNSPVDRWDELHDEYVRVRARSWSVPRRVMRWVGAVRGSASVWVARSHLLQARNRDLANARAGARLHDLELVDGGQGLYDDGWVAPVMTCRVRALTPAPRLEIAGWIPETDQGSHALTVHVGDRSPVVTALVPGTFVVSVPADLAAADVVELRLAMDGPPIDAVISPRERRDIGWRLTAVAGAGSTDDPRAAVVVHGGRLSQAWGGLYSDGWAAAESRCEIEAYGPAERLRVEGWSPGHEGGTAQLSLRAGDGAWHAVHIAPGEFVAEFPIAVQQGDRLAITLRCSARIAEEERPTTERRPLAWQHHSLALVP